MITNNPFAELSEFIHPFFMQTFVLIMIFLVILGTVLDMIHKKNVHYFFQNAKKSKKQAKKILSLSDKSSVVFKTIASEVLTTSELGLGKRRFAHLLGMYGSIIFWISSVILIFCYPYSLLNTPFIYPALWHIGAIMTCVGGYWFWFFLRVDVSSEAYPWYRIIQADLFVLSLVITSTMALLWSLSQTLDFNNLEVIFLLFYILSNIILFGGVYWSKFAHMFYKPGAAIQRNLAEADGSRDNLPEPSDKPKKFGLGIKREAPKHY